MRFGGFSSALVLAFLLSGCTRGPGKRDWHLGPFISAQHGQVDFASPSFEWSIGSTESVMLFDDSTVICMGGAYYTLGAPYYLLLAGFIALGAVPLVVCRLRKRRRSLNEDVA